MRWRLEEIAREKERKGNRMWRGYEKLIINGLWWKWDKAVEVLKDETGNIREKSKGEVKEREKR